MKLTKSDLRSIAFAIEILLSVEKRSLSAIYRDKSAKHRLVLRKIMLMVTDAICQYDMPWTSKLQQDIDSDRPELKGIEAILSSKLSPESAAKLAASIR